MSAETDHATHAERSLPGAEERLRLALAAGRMGIWELELERNYPLILSAELQTIFGPELGVFDGQIRSFVERVYPADRAVVLKTFAKAIRDRTDPELEFRFVRPERSPGWLLARGRVYRDAEARAPGWRRN
jgi:PAS domain-containing protein